MEERVGNTEAVEPAAFEAGGILSTGTEAVEDYDALINTVCPKLTLRERIVGRYNRWMDFELRILYRDLAFVGSIIAFPIKVFTWAIVKYKTWTYDPQISEKSKCPACGYRGCRINFVEMPDQAVLACIELTCNRCSAKSYVPTIYKLNKWYKPQQPQIRGR